MPQPAAVQVELFVRRVVCASQCDLPRNPRLHTQAGLVDDLVAAEQLLPAAEATMARLLSMPDAGRVIVKQRFREEFSSSWEAYPEQEVEGAWAMLSAPATVKALEATLARLSGKKGRAKL